MSNFAGLDNGTVSACLPAKTRIAPSEEAIETDKTTTTPNVLHSPSLQQAFLQETKLFLQSGDEHRREQIYILGWDAGCGGVTRICGSGDRARRGDEACCPGAMRGWLPSGLGALRGVMGCGWDSRR